MVIIGNIFHVNLLIFSHCFISISDSHLRENSISVYQAKNNTSVVDKYLDITIIKKITKLYNTTLPYDMILIKDYEYTIDDQVDKLSRDSTFNRGIVLDH